MCLTPNHFNRIQSVRYHTAPLYSNVRTAAMFGYPPLTAFPPSQHNSKTMYSPCAHAPTASCNPKCPCSDHAGPLSMMCVCVCVCVCVTPIHFNQSNVCVCVCVCVMTPQSFKSCSNYEVQLLRPTTKQPNYEFLCSCAPSTGCCGTGLRGTDKHATIGVGVCAPTAPCIPSLYFHASLCRGPLG